MKKTNLKSVAARTLSVVTKAGLQYAANSRCAFVYHQPKQPKNLKEFRKF